MRIYDPRVGRFLSVDPITKNYPWYTPYQFAGNKPTWATDIDGLEENTTSTYVSHPPILSLKPAFNGIISITDATSQTAHKTFEGNFSQLVKADPSKLSLGIVNQLTGSNTGTNQSRLDISMLGSRTEVDKSWQSTDVGYYQQYSYTFTNNNITQKGTFEIKLHTLEGTKIYAPAIVALADWAIGSIIPSNGGVTPYEIAKQSTTTESLQASQQVYNGATLYRIGTRFIN
jgi:hypothetical protein